MTRQPVERTFTSHDGAELFYRVWPAETVTAKGAVLLFHRGHEHGGRMAHIVDEINMAEYTFFAWDARGHGKSPGERGDAPSFGCNVQDVDAFVHHVNDAHGFKTEDIAVIAQSVGAVTVSAWVHDYAPKLRALVLASPAFSVKLYVPFARCGLSLMQKLRGNFYINSYVKSKFLTHDVVRQQSFDADDLVTRQISVRILLGLYETAERVVKDARAITVPTQLLVSGADYVVHHEPQHEFFVNLGALTKERHIMPGFYHDTLGEKDRANAFTNINRFINACFAEPPACINLLDADKYGHTRDEADRLASPLSCLSPAGIYWCAYRLNLKIGGLISDGIALGHHTGFDSGSTLDYVYRNEAKGAGPLGRVADRHYLDAVGWKGIRQRKENLGHALRRTIGLAHDAGVPLRIVDIAAGHGRYVLEALAGAPQKPESILLQDYSDINVVAGTALIAEKNLADIAWFEKGDAFDSESLAAITPAPGIAIVSGLYELFPDNAMIKRSLDGLAQVVPAGGYLIYTGQPWHPQLEMIARALTSHREGQAWIMRRRTQGEMDQLVAAAGFEKIAQYTDEWGIFTVSIARKV